MKFKLYRNTLILVIFSILIFQNFCYAQEDGEDIVIGKYRKIHSNILNEDRLLMIHLPRHYENSDMRYPVIYVLYGQNINDYFAPAVIHTENLGNTFKVIDFVRELSANAYLNLMDQYRPEYHAYVDRRLGRRITRQEFEEAIHYARAAGLKRLAS